MSQTPLRRLTAQDVRAVVGEIEPSKIAAILALQPTASELEEAAVQVAGESDVMGDLERPLAGRSAQIYEILTAEEDVPEA